MTTWPQQSSQRTRWPKVVALLVVLGLLLAAGGFFGKRELDARSRRSDARAAAAAEAVADQARKERVRRETEEAQARAQAEHKAAAALAPIIYEQVSWALGVKYGAKREIYFDMTLFNNQRAIEVLKAQPRPGNLDGAVTELISALERLLVMREASFRARLTNRKAAEDAADLDIGFAWVRVRVATRRVQEISDVAMPAPLVKEFE